MLILMVNIMSTIKTTNRTKGGVWRSLTDKPKRHGGTKLAVNGQSEKPGSTKQEINDSDMQKQDILTYCQLAIALSNIINYNISILRADVSASK
jgi:hypothetical protein